MSRERKTTTPSRYVSFLWLLAVLLVFVVSYFFISNKINKKLIAMARQESEYQVRILELAKEEKNLLEQISLSQTDAFIENEARTKYGYLKPGEMRFEILNPEALYEDDVISPPHMDDEDRQPSHQTNSGEVG